jgi:hypothetical protein
VSVAAPSIPVCEEGRNTGTKAVVSCVAVTVWMTVSGSGVDTAVLEVELGGAGEGYIKSNTDL